MKVQKKESKQSGNPARSLILVTVCTLSLIHIYSINEVHFQQKDGGIITKVTSTFRGKTITTEASGNGRLDAVLSLIHISDIYRLKDQGLS